MPPGATAPPRARNDVHMQRFVPAVPSQPTGTESTLTPQITGNGQYKPCTPPIPSATDHG